MVHGNINTIHPNCDFLVSGLQPSLTNLLRLKRNYGATKSGTIEFPCTPKGDWCLTEECKSTGKSAIEGVGDLPRKDLATPHIGGRHGQASAKERGNFRICERYLFNRVRIADQRRHDGKQHAEQHAIQLAFSHRAPSISLSSVKSCVNELMAASARRN